MTHELADALVDVQRGIAKELPSHKVYYLDAGFLFGGGFPMFPHLSHSDGRKLEMEQKD